MTHLCRCQTNRLSTWPQDCQFSHRCAVSWRRCSAITKSGGSIAREMLSHLLRNCDGSRVIPKSERQWDDNHECCLRIDLVLKPYMRISSTIWNMSLGLLRE